MCRELPRRICADIPDSGRCRVGAARLVGLHSQELKRMEIASEYLARDRYCHNVGFRGNGTGGTIIARSRPGADRTASGICSAFNNRPVGQCSLPADRAHPANPPLGSVRLLAAEWDAAACEPNQPSSQANDDRNPNHSRASVALVDALRPAKASIASPAVTPAAASTIPENGRMLLPTAASSGAIIKPVV